MTDREMQSGDKCGISKKKHNLRPLLKLKPLTTMTRFYLEEADSLQEVDDVAAQWLQGWVGSFRPHLWDFANEQTVS